MAFKPIRKNSVKDTIKSFLLGGYIIRADHRDETPLEVIDRKYIGRMPNSPNIGQFEDVVTRIHCSHDNLYSVVKELENEDYSMSRVFCACSGCCQYTTYAYSVDGE